MFIMDYGSIERCFTSKIQVKIRNADEIQGAIKTYSEYSAINPDLFPHEHLKDLRYNLEETKKLEKSGELKRLQVKCWAEPRGLATFEVLPI